MPTLLERPPRAPAAPPSLPPARQRASGHRPPRRPLVPPPGAVDTDEPKRRGAWWRRLVGRLVQGLRQSLDPACPRCGVYEGRVLLPDQRVLAGSEMVPCWYACAHCNTRWMPWPLFAADAGNWW